MSRWRASARLLDVSGVALGQFKAEGSGFTADQIIETLQGSLVLGLEEGALEGIDIWYEIRKAPAVIKGMPAPRATRGAPCSRHCSSTPRWRDGLIRTMQLPDGSAAVSEP